jgi:Transposase DDE domain
MERDLALKGLDDWEVVCQFLPPSWKDAARELGALRRARGIRDADVLLRVLMVHLVDGCSLKETALRVRQAGWCSISSVALFKRLRAAEQWLRWLAEQLWRRQSSVITNAGYRVRAVDATTVQEQGATGTDWRVHFVINLLDLQCDHFELTDVKGGETFRRIPVSQGDLLLGDRAYGTPPGINHVVSHGGAVLVRVNHRSLPLYDSGGNKIALATWMKSFRIGEVGDLSTWVHVDDQRIRGRLIAVKRGRQAARYARARLRQTARKKQKRLSRAAIFLAGYFYVWTTIPSRNMKSAQILELYRVRWQIELAFKRMKSIMGLGQLPKYSEASSRAWIHGKLFIALLLERLLDAAEHFSPWGYRLETTTEPLA